MEISGGDVQSLLRAGIAAARAGDKAEARRLLLQVVESDERSETAWLWLSGVVETDVDRRVCLENVLALNPQNELAQRGLAKLGVSSQAEAGAEIVVRKE